MSSQGRHPDNLPLLCWLVGLFRLLWSLVVFNEVINIDLIRSLMIWFICRAARDKRYSSDCCRRIIFWATTTKKQNHNPETQFLTCFPFPKRIELYWLNIAVQYSLDSIWSEHYKRKNLENNMFLLLHNCIGQMVQQNENWFPLLHNCNGRCYHLSYCGLQPAIERSSCRK